MRTVRPLAVLAVSWFLASIGGGPLDRLGLDISLVAAGSRARSDHDGSRKLASRVIIVDVSETSEPGRLVIDRGKLARVIDRLRALDAWVIGIDLLFERSQDAAGDQVLLDSIRHSGRVILGTRYHGPDQVEVPSIFAAEALATGIVHLVASPGSGFPGKIQHYYDMPAMPSIYSLSLQLARFSLSMPDLEPASVEPRTRALLLKSRGGVRIRIPVDPAGLTLNQGLAVGDCVPVFSWKDVLSGDTGGLDVAGRTVLLGCTSLELHDTYRIPFARSGDDAMAGVMIHARNLAAILQGNLYQEIGGELRLLLQLSCGAVGIWIALVSRTFACVALGSLGAVCLLAGGALTFASAGIYCDPARLVLGFLLALVLSRVSRGTRDPDRSVRDVVGPEDASWLIRGDTAAGGSPPEDGSSSPRIPAELKSALAPRYRDVCLLGEGGMARVYRAHDRELGRDVAVKVPRADAILDEASRRRFFREIAALARLDHPSIVRIHDFAESPLAYYAMELLTSGSLRDRLADTGRIGWVDVLRTLTPIASALAACHQAGIVHRDLKPENILFDTDGRALLTDFGVAHQDSSTRLTMTRATVGTPYYMAPEQIEGQRPSPAVDVYAFGLVLYEALAGTHPYEEMPLTVRMVRSPPSILQRIPDLPPGLVRVIGRCLAIDPLERCSDGLMLLGDLETIRVDGDPQGSRFPPPDGTSG